MSYDSFLRDLYNDLKEKGRLISNSEKTVLQRSFYFKNALYTYERDINNIIKIEQDKLEKLKTLSELKGRLEMIYFIFSIVLTNNPIKEKAKELINTIDNEVSNISFTEANIQQEPQKIKQDTKKEDVEKAVLQTNPKDVKIVDDKKTEKIVKLSPKFKNLKKGSFKKNEKS